MRRCVVGVRREDAPVVEGHGRFAPTVWFPSMATMAAVLSEDNRAMLRLIDDLKPKSLTELAELTGRQVPNLSRTLRMMEGYEILLNRHFYRYEPPRKLAVIESEIKALEADIVRLLGKVTA